MTMTGAHYQILRDYEAGRLVDVSPIARIECPCACHVPTDDGQCRICSDRGWLYPDPPAWWRQRYVEGGWTFFCDMTWQLFRMYEYREGNDETA